MARRFVNALLLVSLAPFLAACTGNVSSRAVREQIAELGDARLMTDDIQVQRIVTELGDRVVAEANIRMAFLFERDGDGELRIVAARLGDRRWIDIADLMAAIETRNTDETAASLEKLALGLSAYRARNGTLPDMAPGRYLSDVLHPLFMTDLVRDDAWGGRIDYTARDTGYELRAPGPDGAAGTADDIVFAGP